MKRTKISYVVAVVALGACLGGCSKSDNASGDASASPDAIASAVASDTGTVVPLASPTGATAAATEIASPGASVAPGASSAASPAVSASVAAVSFTDVAGVNGEKEITELAQLGAIDPASGSFEPGSPIKRRDFIRWLVKTNNVLYAALPAKRIQLADKTETSSFPDIATTDPDFPYVQGMQDAGYSVGFPDKTFKPEQSLTREQMFAIKNVFDRGSVDPEYGKEIDYARHTVMPPWKDREQISKTYVPAIATGTNGGSASFSLVYGASSLFKPQQAVTRAQAAVAVSVIGDHSFYGNTERTVAQALASPAP